jgi:hypothetical protein
MAQNIPRGTPARVLVLLTMLVGLVVVSAWRDALQRDTGTWVRYPTALGDTGLLLQGQFPVRLDAGGKIVTLTAGGAAFHRRDDRMFRVVTGAGVGLDFTLFSSKEILSADAEPKLYGRTGPHQYVRLRAKMGGSATSLVAPGALRVTPEPPVLKAIPVEPGEDVFAEGTRGKGTL